MYRVNKITRNDKAGRLPVGRRTSTAVAALLLGVAFSAAPAGAQQESSPTAKKQAAGTTGQKDRPKPASPIILPDSNSVQLHVMDGPPARVRPAAAPPSETPTGPVTGAPGIRCSETIKNFGLRWAGPPLEHTFIVRNEGDQPLELLKVKASCGCTAARNFDKVIAPGEEGKIPVVLDTKKVRRTFTKYVTVTSNDPVTPKLRLRITGEIKAHVSVAPRAAAFSHIAEDAEPGLKVITLKNNTEDPLMLTLVSPTSGPFGAEVVETEPGKTFELRVSARPPYQPKLNQGKFVLKTNMKGQPTVEVPVTAYVPPRLELTPVQLVLAATVRKDQDRLFRFTNNGSNPVKLVSADAGDSPLEVEVVERQEGKKYDVKVRIPAGFEAPPKDKAIYITLATDDPKTPELKIPVSGRPKRGRPANTLVGKRAPAAEFTTRHGQSVRTGVETDKVTVLDFFASWCGFCKKQIPTLAALHKEKFADNPNVQFIGVNGDTLKVEGVTNKRARTPKQIADMWARTGAKFDYALDPQKHSRSRFKVNSYPTLLLVDQQGTVQAVHFGAKGNLAEVLEKEINQLLAGESLAKAKLTEPAATDLAAKIGALKQARQGPVVKRPRRRRGTASDLVRRLPVNLTPANKLPPEPPAETTDQTEDEAKPAEAEADQPDPAKDES